jgi:hypothetical protein
VRRIFLFFVLVLLICLILSSVRFIPHISGRVVDAVTGRPVPGMRVCLYAEVRDFTTGKALRSETQQTNAAGDFSFAASFQKLDFFQHWLGYSIRVTDPKLEAPYACGASLVPAALGELVDRQNRGVNQISGTIYFPVAIVDETGRPNPLPLGAMRREMGFPIGMRVALIPLLQNAGECLPIQDGDIAGFCRELNNSAVADVLRHRIRAAQN